MKAAPNALLSVAIAATALVIGGASLAAAEEPSAAQRRTIDALLDLPPSRLATTRPMNPVLDFAIVCRDLATVDFLIDATTRARTDRITSRITAGRTEFARAAAAEPDVAAYGCVKVLPGVRVTVEQDGAAPLINTGAVRGVTHPAMLDYRPR